MAGELETYHILYTVLAIYQKTEVDIGVVNSSRRLTVNRPDGIGDGSLSAQLDLQLHFCVSYIAALTW